MPGHTPSTEVQEPDHQASWPDLQGDDAILVATCQLHGHSHVRRAQLRTGKSSVKALQQGGRCASIAVPKELSTWPRPGSCSSRRRSASRSALPAPGGVSTLKASASGSQAAHCRQRPDCTVAPAPTVMATFLDARRTYGSVVANRLHGVSRALLKHCGLGQLTLGRGSPSSACSCGSVIEPMFDTARFWLESSSRTKSNSCLFAAAPLSRPPGLTQALVDLLSARHEPVQ